MAERKWTHDEAAQLIELAEAGLTVEEIGDQLDRTGGAVRVKANRIGVDFYVRDIGKFHEKRRSEKLDCMMCSLPMVSTWAGHRMRQLQENRAVPLRLENNSKGAVFSSLKRNPSKLLNVLILQTKK